MTRSCTDKSDAFLIGIGLVSVGSNESHAVSLCEEVLWKIFSVKCLMARLWEKLQDACDGYAGTQV